ncbi:MAG: VRR-NUC domain-containing protein [Deltaproteobacteria bacterium]|nr:VRR-NUC domain-containing protein [Deltaproteobacteria bacterium]
MILETLLREGWRAARGLPDLVVLPGPRIRLPGAMPSRLGEGLVLAEVKGPTDSVRDEQAAWFDRLLGAGAKVELWQVSAGRGSPMPTADHSG